MNKNFIFIKNNNETFLYYLSFIPLIIYGLYKNGYLIYKKGLISIWLLFKPLYLVLIGIIIKVMFSFF